MNILICLAAYDTIFEILALLMYALPLHCSYYQVTKRPRDQETKKQSFLFLFFLAGTTVSASPALAAPAHPHISDWQRVRILEKDSSDGFAVKAMQYRCFLDTRYHRATDAIIWT